MLALDVFRRALDLADGDALSALREIKMRPVAVARGVDVELEVFFEPRGQAV
jgi:hypothetical protein